MPVPDHAAGAIAVVVLRHDAAAVPLARRALVDDLRRDAVDDDLVADVAVVASELLGNAVRHAHPLAGGELHLRWQVDGPLVRVCVMDGGGGQLVDRAPSAAATGGRGLGIVSALAERWGQQVDDDGRRTVWAALTGPVLAAAG